MTKEIDPTEITVVATVTDDSEDVWVVRADGPDAEKLAYRVFDVTWQGEEDGSVPYHGVTLEGRAVVRSGRDRELDLRGMRTEAEVDAAIRAEFGVDGPAPGP